MVAEKSYDVVVIGAGGVGNAAAYQCSRDGLRVLLVEQFKVGHTRGSSHGDSRIIRYAHNHVDYASQMPATFQLWFELEALSQVQLLQMTGGIFLGQRDEPWLVDCCKTLSTLAMPYEVLQGAEVSRDYPQFRIPADWIGVTETNAGILAASRCVRTMVEQAIALGATLLEEAPVASLTAEGEGVKLRLQNGEVYRASRAIVAAGPWSSRFLEQWIDYPVPLRVTPQQVAYFPVEDPALYAVGRFPLFIVQGNPHFYGFPCFERPGLMKIALEQSSYTQDPDETRVVNQGMVDALSAAVAATLVGVGPRPVAVEPCLYTDTPTRDFVIDRLPDQPQIVVAAGFSGRGFKHTIAIGRLLADLTQSDPGTYASEFWRESYRVGRFAPVAG